MKYRRLSALIAALSAAVLAAPPAGAQNAYEEPKVTSLGKADASIAVAGKGTVVVQVFVKADGSAQVKRVIRSTNPGDNDAALSIAKNSTYAPATRLGKPVDAFKDFTLSFNDGGVSSAIAAGTGAPAGSAAQMESLLRAGNYQGARDAANSYLGSHPGSPQAFAVLGAAQSQLKDYPAAADAFDKAGKLPAEYVPFAVQAYVGNAAALNAGDKSAEAVASAKKAVALDPGGASYNALGLAELGANDPAGAAAALEQASKLANADPKVPANVRATILANLAGAYAAGGSLDKAKAAVAQAQQLDPKSNAGETAAGQLSVRADRLAADKKFPDAAAAYTAAAEFSTANAARFYAFAASCYLRESTPEAQKALDSAQKSVAADPNSVDGLYTMGVAYAELGKRDNARDALQKALVQAKAANQGSRAADIEDKLKQLDAGAK
jgi:tetratricopeptide (TPR) repeat protein